MTGNDMNGKDRFSTYNPIINFLFFVGAFVFGMVFVHPLFLLSSFVLASAYYLTVKGIRGLRLVYGMIPLFIFMSILNPLFNTSGSTVLFTYSGGRPYTFEALCYGMALSAMFVTVITWFAAYNTVMTSDKLLYVFGKAAPAVSLILTMVLRLVPEYRRKAHQIRSARRCIGKAEADGTGMEKAVNGLVVVSALTSWALEGGIVMADSMKSRGYGCGRRSAFSVYSFGSRDKILTVFMALLIGVIIFCAIMGGARVSYTPEFHISSINNIYTVAGAAAYFIFLAIPAGMNITEAIIWHILRSKI